MTFRTALRVSQSPSGGARASVPRAFAAFLVLASIASVLTVSRVAYGQVGRGAPLPTAPKPPVIESQRSYDATELDRIVSPIALYPDPLLAQLLNAATFPQQIPVAAQWLDAHRGMSGQQLTDQLANDRVTWDPSVQAMVAFPTVLQMMASAAPWTDEIGDAFTTQHADVMDAVQRMRAQAQRYGYLQSNEQMQVSSSPIIEILPVNPAYIVVPYYDPYVVYYPPRPRFVVSSAIYFGYGVRLGGWYEPWGWRQSGFEWSNHRVVYGYPGWNHPRDYRVVNPRGYGNAPRYEPRNDPRPITRTPEPFRRVGPRDADTRQGNNNNVRVTQRELERERPRDAQRGGSRETMQIQRGGNQPSRESQPTRESQPRNEERSAPHGERRSAPPAGEMRTAQPRPPRDAPKNGPPAERERRN